MKSSSETGFKWRSELRAQRDLDLLNSINDPTDEDLGSEFLEVTGNDISGGENDPASANGIAMGEQQESGLWRPAGVAPLTVEVQQTNPDTADEPDQMNVSAAVRSGESGGGGSYPDEEVCQMDSMRGWEADGSCQPGTWQ